MKIMSRAVLLAMFGLAVVTTEARADGWLNPFVGVNFGGDAGGKFEEVADEASHLTYGANVGGMFGGIFGAEFDFAYTKDFYGSSDVSDSKVMTFVPSLVIGIPVGGQNGPGIRPYLTAGAGVLRRDFSILGDSVFDDNVSVLSVGGGVMGFVNDRFGIRADYRYIRAFESDDIDITDLDLNIDLGTFNYSRASIGALFRF